MDVQFSTRPLHEIAGDLMVVGVADQALEQLTDLDRLFDGQLFELARRNRFVGKPGTSLALPTMGKMAVKDLLLVGIGDRAPQHVRSAAALAGKRARNKGLEDIALHFGVLPAELARSTIEHFLAGNYRYDAHKPEAKRKHAATRLTLVGPHPDDERLAERARIAARWQSFTRDLINAPAAEIYPESLAQRAKELEELPGVRVEILDMEACRAQGYAGIVAVGQGSAQPPCLIHVRYRPEGARGHVALVGKGITFDSGGLSLKPSGSMQTMRGDMGGAGTVLGAVALAAESGLPIAVDAIIGAAENMISGTSYRLGDVITYANGVTVEVHNTDAEGRLVMADALIRACKEPGVTDVVDVATLTGACVVAVGSDFTGLMTSDDALATELQRAGEVAGERLWRLPMHAPYAKHLEAEWAQIKNVGGREAGATVAALFLEHFVEGVRWAHLDVAGAAFIDKGKPGYAAGATGEMVRTLGAWIADRAR